MQRFHESQFSGVSENEFIYDIFKFVFEGLLHGCGSEVRDGQVTVCLYKLTGILDYINRSEYRGDGLNFLGFSGVIVTAVEPQQGFFLAFGSELK